MKTAGFCLLIVGAMAALVSFFLPTTVESYSTYSIGGGGTLNLGLLQNQMMVLHVGLAGFIGGAVLYGCGEVAQRLGTADQVALQAAEPAEVQAPPEPLDGSIADGIAIKIIFGFIVAVLMVLLFIYLSNRPQTITVGSTNVNELIANTDAEAARLADEADALANSAESVSKR